VSYKQCLSVLSYDFLRQFFSTQPHSTIMVGIGPNNGRESASGTDADADADADGFTSLGTSTPRPRSLPSHHKIIWLSHTNFLSFFFAASPPRPHTHKSGIFPAPGPNLPSPVQYNMEGFFGGPIYNSFRRTWMKPLLVESTGKISLAGCSDEHQVSHLGMEMNEVHTV
jgi:hypothetical protein